MGKNKRLARSSLTSLPTSVFESLRNSTTNGIDERDVIAGQKRAAEPIDTPAPAKKQKVGLLGPDWQRHDATGLVPFYTKKKDVPEKLQKYFYQRERLFSLYNEGCLLDEEGWYSVTPEAIAEIIAEKCRCNTVLDAFCGVGGNAIAFAKTCERVIAIDTSETRLRLARHNAVIYGVADRIEFILGDYVSFAETYLKLPQNARKTIDVIFLSPPWGGVDYTSSPKKNATVGTNDPDVKDEEPNYGLDRIKPIHGAKLFRLSREITPHVAYFLPKHVNLQEVSDLLPSRASDEEGKTDEKIEVQEAWTGSKLKAITCYFGGLAEGQEEMYPY